VKINWGKEKALPQLAELQRFCPTASKPEGARPLLEHDWQIRKTAW